MPVRHAGNEPFAARRPAVTPRHIGRCPGLIDEDQVRRVQIRLLFAPARAGGGAIRAGLLGGVVRLFLSVRPSRSSAFHIPPWLTDIPWLESSQARSSSSVASGYVATRWRIAAW